MRRGTDEVSSGQPMLNGDPPSIGAEGLAELGAAVGRGARSAVSLVAEILERIDRFDGDLHSYVHVSRDGALAAAAEVDRRVRAGQRVGPLAGVPVSIKDVYAVRGVPTTQGSRAYGGTPARRDAAVVELLRRAGAIILGVNTCHELAYGPTGDVSFHHAAVNPYDAARVPGGSSSGSAVATAAGLAIAAVGSDTGGSVRIPASCCGVVGIKPTAGSVSRRGMLHLAPSLDHVGLLTRSVDDSRALLAVLASHDVSDPASRIRVEDESSAPTDLRSMRVGVLGGYFGRIEDESVKEAFDDALDRLRDLGVTTTPVVLDTASSATQAQRTITTAEAAVSHRERLAQAPNQFGDEVRQRLRGAKTLSAVDYVGARRAADEFRAELLEAFARVDVAVCPTTPILPPRVGQRDLGNGPPTHVYEALTRFTAAFNTVDTPALSVPIGYSATGLPIGLQVVARPFKEVSAYQVAAAIEKR